MGVGARIRDYIDDNDLEQKQLAELLDIHPATLNSYLRERNRLPAEVLGEISKLLDVSSDYLLGLTREERPPLSLSESERNLMTDFRTLTKAQKELIAANVRLMKEQNKR